MTDPRLRDPAANRAHYAENTGYRRDDSRLSEPRVLWAAEKVRDACARGARRVLDVGCNDGFLAEILPEGVEYTGLELNRVAAANPYPRAVGRIIVLDVTAGPWPPGMWDVAVCMEVLEHVPDPSALLRRVSTAIGPGGLLVSTSAAGRGEAHEPGNLEHLREWAPQEFAMLHEAAGFRVLEGLLREVYKGRLTTCILASPRGEAAA